MTLATRYLRVLELRRLRSPEPIARPSAAPVDRGGNDGNGMASLLHEVWEDPDGDGGWLPGLCLAGPDGDGFRALLQPEARCVHTFMAGSHVEAMTIYNDMLGREPYVSDHDWDHAPYPESWALRQRA